MKFMTARLSRQEDEELHAVWESVRMSHIVSEIIDQQRKNELMEELRAERRKFNMTRLSSRIHARENDVKRHLNKIRDYEDRFRWNDNICERPMSQEHLLACAMGTHKRLGEDSPLNTFHDVLRKICDCDRGDSQILDDHICAMSVAHENDEARLVELYRILRAPNTGPGMESRESKHWAGIELMSQRSPYTSKCKREVRNRQRPHGGSRLSEMD
jgi:hypothetical protein